MPKQFLKDRYPTIHTRKYALDWDMWAFNKYELKEHREAMARERGYAVSEIDAKRDLQAYWKGQVECRFS